MSRRPALRAAWNRGSSPWPQSVAIHSTPRSRKPCTNHSTEVMPSVFHADQKKAFGGSGGTGFAFGGCEQRAKAGFVQVALAAFDHRAHHVAHHVLQEAAAPYAVDEAAAGFEKLGGEYRAHFGAAFGIALVGGGEGGEIVLAFKDGRQPDHVRDVERVRVVMHVAVFPRRACRLARDTVFVSLRFRAVA